MPLPPEIVERIHSSPLMSASASRLLQLMSSEETDSTELRRVVEHDSVLTARVLRVANSAALALRQPIVSIDRAVNYLGTRTVIGIALSECAGSLYNRALPGYACDPGALWRHSVRTAVGARYLVGYCRTPVDGGLAYTAGLLHDLGKAVLADFFSAGQTLELNQHQVDDWVDFIHSERHRTGTDHCEVSAELARHWRLPEAFAEVMKHHHQPLRASEEHRALVFAVHLADFTAMMTGADTGADALQYRLEPSYPEWFDLGKERLHTLMLQVDQECLQLEKTLFAPKAAS